MSKMQYSVVLLITLILISSVICGMLIIICAILVCKYCYKYQRNDGRLRNDETQNAKENNCLLIPNDINGQQLINKNDLIEDRPDELNRNENKGSADISVDLVERDSDHLSVSQFINRRHSDDSPMKDETTGFQARPRSVSHTITLQAIKIDSSKIQREFNEDGIYRKNSFHLRPFDLSPQAKGKISYSMEFINHKKTPSYEEINERKVRSFDSELIRKNSKSLNVIGVEKCKSKELSKSLVSYLQKLSKAKSKNYDEKKKSSNNTSKVFKHSNNIEVSTDLDLAYSCPYQMSKNHESMYPKDSSQDSSVCISSFDSSEMNEAFLAVSREIHNSCDSDLCFKSATVKRKQFFREKRKHISSSAEPRKPNNQFIQCSSANQSMERDYSIDEKSSAIFIEFLRNDPSFDKFVMEESVRQRLRSERGFSHHNSQNRRRSKTRVIDAFKSASFTDGDSHPQGNVHANSYESQSEHVNRSPSPIPMIILSTANQF